MEPEALLALTMLFAIVLYAVLGGADFGAGVWEFSTALRATKRQREHIYKAIGPVWEANHVWLIFVMVILMNGFPPAFAGISRALWFPLMFAVWGIIFRGAGYAFRSYARGGRTELSVWEALFAVGSTAAPWFLGAAAGAMASGNLEIAVDGSFAGSYWHWMAVLPVFLGFYNVGLCSYLAAIYLTREAAVGGQEDLVALWRTRSLVIGTIMGVLSAVGLAVLWWQAHQLASGLMVRAWWLVVASNAAGVGSLCALWLRRYSAAAMCAAVAVATVILGWGVAQYPALLPSVMTLEQAAAPDQIIWLMLGIIVTGSIMMLPALVYLFWLFKRDESENLPLVSSGSKD